MTRPSNKRGFRSQGPRKTAFIHPSYQGIYRMQLKKTAYKKMKESIEAREEKQSCH